MSAIKHLTEGWVLEVRRDAKGGRTDFVRLDVGDPDLLPVQGDPVQLHTGRWSVTVWIEGELYDECEIMVRDAATLLGYRPGDRRLELYRGPLTDYLASLEAA